MVSLHSDRIMTKTPLEMGGDKQENPQELVGLLYTAANSKASISNKIKGGKPQKLSSKLYVHAVAHT